MVQALKQKNMHNFVMMKIESFNSCMVSEAFFVCTM